MSDIADRLGPGAFTILYPPGEMKGSGTQSTAYRIFRDRLRALVGDPERSRADVGQAIGVLANPQDPFGDALVRIPGRGVTVVDPANVVRDAGECVRNCGPSAAAAIGEIVTGLQRPLGVPFPIQSGVPETK